MSEGDRFLPRAIEVSTTLLVELVETQEFSSLGNVLLVVRSLLGILPITDFLVLRGSQTTGDVRFRSDLSRFELKHSRQRNDRREL